MVWTTGPRIWRVRLLGWCWCRASCEILKTERETPPCEHTRVFVCAAFRDICKEMQNAALFFLCVCARVCGSSSTPLRVAVLFAGIPEAAKKKHRLTDRGLQLSQRQLLFRPQMSDGTKCSVFLRPGVDLRAPKFSQHHAVISLVRILHRIFKEQAAFKRRVLQGSG